MAEKTSPVPRIDFEDFIEVTTRAVARAMAARDSEVELNPQPLPPGEKAANLLARRPGPIIIGIVAAPAQFLE